jgi:hypothetical protein
LLLCVQNLDAYIICVGNDIDIIITTILILLAKMTINEII